MKNCNNTAETEILNKIHESVSEFRTKFLERRRESLQKYYVQLAKEHTWESVCKQIDEGWKNARIMKIRYFDCTDEYKRLRRLEREMWWIKENKVEQRINILIKDIENNLLDKEQKLARRLVTKGFTPEFTLTFNCYDPNLQGMVTEGDKKLRVWTIIAGGEIQRMHYRYLLK